MDGVLSTDRTPVAFPLSSLTNPRYGYAASERVAAERASHLLKYEFVGFRFWRDVCDGSTNGFGILAEDHAGLGDKVTSDIYLNEGRTIVSE